MKKIYSIFPAGMLIYGAICGAYYLLQEKLIFHPIKLPESYQFPFKTAFSEHNLIAPDNAKINMVWFKSVAPKGVILYCHGNADNIERWGKITERLVPLGYDVMIHDYRGFGKSTGNRSEETLFSDAQMVYDFAKTQYSENQIITYGRSLGTGIATYLAANNEPKTLILETPYFSMLDMSQRYSSLLPTEVLLRYQLRTDLNIVKVKCPITIFHGTKDEVVPYESGLKLKALLKNGDEFVTILNGMHGDLEFTTEYQTSIAKLLE